MEKAKVLVVVQCRYNSNRLPGKALYPIAGIPLLSFLLKRLKVFLSKKSYRIVLATTKEATDDIIADWGKTEGLDVHRGASNNVLYRFVSCLESFSADTVVRVTADNPLTCPDILEWLVTEKQEKRSEYVQCKNIPAGSGTDVFSSETIETLCRRVKRDDEKEHINLYIYRHPEMFKTYFPELKSHIARPDIRVTVDTKEDWQHINLLFDKKDDKPWEIPLSLIIERYDRITFNKFTEKQINKDIASHKSDSI